MARYVFADPKPFAHQRAGLKEIIANDGRYALLWEPGTGKTRAVIDYAGCLATAKDGPVTVLVICPKAVQDSWVKQAEAFLGPAVGLRAMVLTGSVLDKCAQLKAFGSGKAVFRRPGDVRARRQVQGNAEVRLAVLNLEALSTSKTVASGYRAKTHGDFFAETVERFSPDLLVVDEMHRAKSPTSNVSKMLRKLAQYSTRKIGLTGTPMPHSPMDIWAQWQIFDQQAFSTGSRGWPFSVFRAHYATMGGFYGKQVVGYTNLEDLQDRMAKRSMSLTKADCLDLPPTMTVPVPVHLSSAEMTAYNAMKHDLVTRLAEAGTVMTAGNRLTQMLRLRQVTCGFVKDDDTGEVVRVGRSREDTAVSLLEDLLAGENRVVVFAWSREEVDSLVARMEKAKPYGAHTYGITGDTADGKRMQLRELFGDRSVPDKLVLVCQARTVSLGINEFVTASHALFLSLSQQRDDLIQAMARLDRQGQTKSVTFHVLMAPGTVDEVIWNSHQKRSDLEGAMMEHLRGTHD